MTNSAEKPIRQRGTLGRQMVGVGVTAVALFVLRPVYNFADSWYHGPMTRSYDLECQLLADAGQIVGKPEAEAIRVLGEPAEVWEYDQPEGRTKTLAYSPSLFSGSSTFQVHCRDGVVKGIGRKQD